MKIQVDTHRCQGTGMCIAVAPELFELLPDGLARVLVDDVGPDLTGLVEDALLACPTAALSAVED